MSRQEVLQLGIAVTLILLFLVGCGGTAPTPVAESPAATSTPEPPTSTPTPEPPTPTAVPTATPTPTPTTGIITGMVLDNDGEPLVNIYDQEILIVALVCPSDDSDIECLHESFWDMDTDVLFDSICEADDTSSNCLLHLGQGAASVEADGSYTIADVPPGQYGLVFMFSGPGLMQTSIKRDVASVQVGEITEYDIATELHRK
jgi:hypothetical protein